MHLFYTPDIDLSKPDYTLTEDESNHCVRVLRLVNGDEIWMCDGRGNMVYGRISDAHPKHCLVEITGCTPDFERRPYTLHIAAAPTKNIERFEWFIEKATEIGIDRITPLLSEHSERKVIKPERIEKVATSAMKQSLKAYHPVIDPLTSFRDLVSAPFDGEKLIAHCEPDPDKRPLSSSFSKGSPVLILIGPEGDFSSSEISFALAHGFRSVSLGQSRLRSETAGVVATHTVALINEL